MTQETSISAYRLYDDGPEYERNGQWAQAESIYRQVIALPNAPTSLVLGSWFRFGYCREQIGTLDQVLEAYRKSIDLPAVWPEAGAHMLFRLGLALQKTGQYFESARRLEAAKALLPVRGLSINEIQASLRKSRALAGEPEDDPVVISRETQDFLDRFGHARNKLSTIIDPEVLHSGRFLDIGCGMGAGVLAAIDLGAAFAAGIDRNLKEFGESPFTDVALAKGLDLSASLLLEGDAMAINFGPPGFDVAMMLDVIEHVPDPPAFIEFAHRVLRPGGLVLIDTCPLYYSPVGHHVWRLAPKEELPWFHLYHDSEEQFVRLKLNEWQHSRVGELNRVTHGQIRQALLKSKFHILMEHETQPREEDLALYEKFKDRIDHRRLPEHGDLFRDWTLFLARKI